METAFRYYGMGDLPRAEQACLGVLRENPRHAQALHLLGIISYQLGRHEEAIESFQSATRLEPTNPAFHNDLGVACAAARRFCEAVAHYGEALRLKPDHAEAHNNLGIALAEQGRLTEAEGHYREAVRLQPDYPAAHNNLGIVLATQERFSEATAHYREAVRLQPDYPAAHNNLGTALAEQGWLKEAEDHYREALRLQPDYPAAYNNLAGALIELGRMGEAVACCQESLRLDPDSTPAHAYLAELATHGLYHFTDGQVSRMESLLAGGRLSREDASRLLFILAARLDRQGEYDRAFALYRRANDLKEQDFRQKNLAFDRERHRRFIDDLIATFDRRFCERVRSFGLDTELPVFVVGMPRSGSTLVAQILSSHPHVVAVGELRDLQETLTAPLEDGGAGEMYPARMAGLDQRGARAMAERYLRRLAGLGGKAARVVDKMLHNYLHLGSIFALFPRARVIHCRRDPLDTCLSCYFQNFTWVNYACRLEDLGFYHRQYERLMRHWREVLPLQVYEVQYEELIRDQERVSRELISFCGLDWSNRCLAFHENARAVRTASKLQVRRPIYTSSMLRWKRYESHLLPLKRALDPAAGAGATEAGPLTVPLPACSPPAASLFRLLADPGARTTAVPQGPVGENKGEERPEPVPGPTPLPLLHPGVMEAWERILASDGEASAPGPGSWAAVNPDSWPAGLFGDCSSPR
jgi:tetratricopeptide (TPR) repeat protein